MKAWLTSLFFFSGMALLLSAPAYAQPYPSQPIKMIVPWTPGGAADLIARAVSSRMAEKISRPVIVENRAGAGGRLGTEIVAAAPADGYTLLLAVGPFTVDPSLHPDLKWDPLRSFTPIAYLGEIPSVIVVAAGSPVQNLAQFRVLAQKSPGSLNFGSAGTGSIMHLGPQLLWQQMGIDVKHIPYAGSPPAMLALLRGDTQIMALPVPLAVAQIKAAKVRPLAMLSKMRSALLPDLRTVGEMGYPGFGATTYYGIVAPAGLRSEIVKQLNGEVLAVLADPKVTESLRDLGVERTEGMATPEAFRDYLAEDKARWGKLIKEAGIKAE